MVRPLAFRPYYVFGLDVTSCKAALRLPPPRHVPGRREAWELVGREEMLVLFGLASNAKSITALNTAISLHIKASSTPDEKELRFAPWRRGEPDPLRGLFDAPLFSGKIPSKA
eukprot:scaffold195309_cov32-Tisochrysis_lutea.AAC.1